MNVVKDIQSFIQLIHSREEVIVFPIGVEGQQLLDFLRYTNFLHRVCCIAALKVEGNNTEQRCIHEVPVIPFENLVHFRETAVFIIVAPTPYHEKFNETFMLFGFKTIAFIGEELQTQIRDSLQRMASSGQIMMWFMHHFDEKITAMERRIEEQNEVCRVNTKAFSEYRNAFLGKEVVIVANGPTLNYYKPIPDAIHIGVNYGWKHKKIPFNYFFACDGNGSRMTNSKVEEGFYRVQSKIFVGKYLARWNLNCLGYYEKINFSSSNIASFYINVEEFGQYIYQDICSHPLMLFGSCVFQAIHFALFTYPKKIYLVGCDVADIGHFYDKKDVKPAKLNLRFIKTGYARVKMFARFYYPDTEIISINPVGLRGLFKDVYTEEYQTALSKEKSYHQKRG